MEIRTGLLESDPPLEETQKGNPPAFTLLCRLLARCYLKLNPLIPFILIQICDAVNDC
jgi:hypothetical protein